MTVRTRWSARCARAAAALLAAALLATGCTSVTTGAAQRAEGGPAPGTVDPTLLNYGNYSTTPLPPMGAAGGPIAGALLDARRMADFVVGPWEADSALVDAGTISFASGGMPLKPGALAAILPSLGSKNTTAGKQMVNGYASIRVGANKNQLLNAVVRMSDPQAATDAAIELAGLIAEAELAGQPLATAPKPLPGHPQTQSVQHTFTVDGRDRNAVQAFTAHGNYLLYQAAYADSGMDAAIALAVGILDRQGPRIDEFVPTDPAEFPTLPRDPSGLLARTLPVLTGEANVNNEATFGAYGLLHYTSNPVIAEQVFADAGVDVGIHGDSWVFRTRDAAGAAAVAELLVGPDEERPTDAVPGMPGSRCALGDLDSKTCVATADRYAFQVGGNQLTDVHQQAAAQYLLLTAA